MEFEKIHRTLEVADRYRVQVNVLATADFEQHHCSHLLALTAFKLISKMY